MGEGALSPIECERMGAIHPTPLGRAPAGQMKMEESTVRHSILENCNVDASSCLVSSISTNFRILPVILKNTGNTWQAGRDAFSQLQSL
jgi:hypothetical protein